MNLLTDAGFWVLDAVFYMLDKLFI